MENARNAQNSNLVFFQSLKMEHTENGNHLLPLLPIPSLPSLFSMPRTYSNTTIGDKGHTPVPARMRAWGGYATVNAAAVVYVPALAMGGGSLSLNREQKIKRR